MKILENNFNALSFTDYSVELMLLNFSLKTLDVKIDGAHFRTNGELKQLGKGRIKIFDWESIYISMYESKNNRWINLNENNYDILKEICEAELNNKLILRGFGKNTGQWIQYEINLPKIDINFIN